ncbi:Type I restriction modification DNA specificity domain [Porphyromonas macacae]|uniref:Type I restriction modification DNA specificity domain n=1 Tax=Porphyromonas macacae TaxID=28115 RepID=A0A379EG87_9PORP|nr:restriction endonuclease subunit S [Porphyromonas macacae]SUB98055.1 Type I restriction modification DNA specificity domain [Porphyromonas macacae]
MKLSEIATYVEGKISSSSISLSEYVTTDSLLPNKEGRTMATNLPPVVCSLTHYQEGDVLVANIRPYLKKIWIADKKGGCSSDVLVFRAKDGCNSFFLYALLLQDGFFNHTMKGAKGSKMPRGDKNQIMRYELPTFSPEEQENIGNIAISITNKLRLNRAINHNLPMLVHSSTVAEVRLAV